MISRRAHTKIQEGIVIAGCILTVSSIYYVFIGKSRVESSMKDSSRLVSVRDILKEEMTAPPKK